MNSDDFEKKLARQPMRTVPSAWRAQILREATLAATPEPVPWLVGLRELFWPRPMAWGSLAAVWVVIAALYLATPATPALTAKQQSPLSRETMQCFVEQRRAMAALLDPVGERPASQQPKQPGPHSGIAREITAA